MGKKKATRFRGFVVSGLVYGGGGVSTGEPRATFEEAWADAQAILKEAGYGDSIPGVEPVEEKKSPKAK